MIKKKGKKPIRCESRKRGGAMEWDTVKQAQKGNSRVRQEMTNKRAKTCLDVKNVKKC